MFREMFNIFFFSEKQYRHNLTSSKIRRDHFSLVTL